MLIMVKVWVRVRLGLRDRCWVRVRGRGRVYFHGSSRLWGELSMGRVVYGVSYPRS